MTHPIKQFKRPSKGRTHVSIATITIHDTDYCTFEEYTKLIDWFRELVRDIQLNPDKYDRVVKKRYTISRRII